MERLVKVLAATIIALAVAMPLERSLASHPPTHATSWLLGWPMGGHDQGRSYLSPVSISLDPRLHRQQRGFYGAIVAPGGAIYGTISSPSGRPGSALVRLSPAGKLRALRSLPDGPVALNREGAVIALGPDDGRAEEVSPMGKLLWHITRLGLPKSAQALVSPDGRLFVPAEGHPEDGSSGLYILTPRGRVSRHLARGTPTFAVARAADGSIYALLLLTPQSGSSSVVAFTPSRHEAWRVRLTSSLETYSACDCLMIGRGGELFAGDGDSLLAIDQSGQVLWRFSKPDSVLALAERSDGAVVMAGTRLLTVVSADGKKLWEADIHTRHAVGSTDQVSKPSLAIDATGTAYVGTPDGEVVVIDRAGNIITRLPAGGYHYGFSPDVMLGPPHSLIVDGTDGTLRVYS